MNLTPPPVREQMFSSPGVLSKAWVLFFQALQQNLIAASTPTASELTISGGEVTVTGSSTIRNHTIDTEGDAASDDLTTINGGNPGEIMAIQAADDARTIVVKKGANMKLQADFTMDDTDDSMLLICVSSGVWKELSRASNG